MYHIKRRSDCIDHSESRQDDHQLAIVALASVFYRQSLKPTRTIQKRTTVAVDAVWIIRFPLTARNSEANNYNSFLQLMVNEHADNETADTGWRTNVLRNVR